MISEKQQCPLWVWICTTRINITTLCEQLEISRSLIYLHRDNPEMTWNEKNGNTIKTVTGVTVVVAPLGRPKK